MSSDYGTWNLALARAFVASLANAGIGHACVCPGSRSTPLALALAEHPGIRVWVHVDERSAGLFALGMARQSQEPVALLCSSGTAAANFLPAVVEANYSRVPLVILTADRPPELRDFGAAQTIDQIRLYGSHVKWFLDMPVPDGSDEVLRHASAVASRAVATAVAGPAGPVHLNFPFREPLVPAQPLAASARETEPASFSSLARSCQSGVSRGRVVPQESVVTELATELTRIERGLIVCGPQDDPALAQPIADLAQALGYPILADPLSQIRAGLHDRSLVIDSYDAFLRDEPTTHALKPDIVLRVGAIPTSKPLILFLQRLAGCQVMIDGDGGWRDPLHRVTRVIHADPSLACSALAEAAKGQETVKSAGAWARAWLDIAARTRLAITDRLAKETDLFEGRVFAELAHLLPAGATLFAGNSMPVRDLDTFFPTRDAPVRFLANRGANGIDGVVSSALGVAAVAGAPVVLVIGDLSFYHDLNGLLAAKLHGLRATIVVLNNDGGGIFSFLPQATYVDAETFETLFGTPVGLNIEAAARLYEASYARPANWEEFRRAVQAAIDGPGLSIIEVRTNRQQNVTQHRDVWAAVAAQLRQQQTA